MSTTEETQQLQQQQQDEQQQHQIGDAQEPHKKLEGDELMEAIRKQVEYYLSRQNLNNDPFLVSHMDKDLYVPIEIIANFKMMKTLTEDSALIIQAVRSSTSVMLDETGTKLRPNFSISRNTVILRDIPSSTSEEEVKKLFAENNQPVSVRSDIGDTWFVTFETDEKALESLDFIRNKTLNDKPIKARIKSENLLKSFTQYQGTYAPNQYTRQNYSRNQQAPYNQYPPQQFENRRGGRGGSGAPRRGGSGSRRGGRDYYNPKPSHSQPGKNIQPNGNLPVSNRPNKSNVPVTSQPNQPVPYTGNYQQQQQSNQQTQQQPQQPYTPNKQRARADSKSSTQQPQSRERSKSFNKKQRQQPQPAPVIDNTKNFPPLPTIPQNDRSKSGYGSDEFTKYSKQLIVDIYANLIKDLKKPDNLPTDCIAVVSTPYHEMELMKPLSGVPTEPTTTPQAESVDAETMISFAEAAITARDIKTPEISTEHLIPRRRRGSNAGKDQLSASRKRSDSNVSNSSIRSDRSDRSDRSEKSTRSTGPQSPASHIHRPEPIKPKFDNKKPKKNATEKEVVNTTTTTTTPSSDKQQTTSYASVLQTQE